MEHPDEFHHPFQPDPVQRDLYEVIVCCHRVQVSGNIRIVREQEPSSMERYGVIKKGANDGDLTAHVIIDEAHNLIDAISALHPTMLHNPSPWNNPCMRQLERYLGLFTSRLNGRNKMFIKQALALRRKLDSFLAAKKNSSR
jgi:hypothetical protein